MAIIKGKRKRPFIALIHGVPGAGKTYLASTMPKPLFIPSELSDEIEAARWERITSWSGLETALAYARDNRKKEGFDTLCIDSLDGFERIAHMEILKNEKPGHTIYSALGGFGRGPRYVAARFLRIREEYLMPLWEGGCNVAIVAHTGKENVEDSVDGFTYERAVPGVDKRTLATFSEWSQLVGFLGDEKVSREGRVTKTGNRILHTSGGPGVVAKNRFGLPDRIVLAPGEGWGKIAPLIKKFYGSDPSGFREMEAMLKQIKNKDVRKQVMERLASGGDPVKAEDFVRTYLEQEAKNGK